MIELKKVNKTYVTGEIETKALKDIDLIINDGEFCVVLGPSGSGKSTLLNVVSGLDIASNGEIIVNNEKVTDYNSEQLTEFRRNNLGFVFQNYNLFQTLTVEENVELVKGISKNPLDTKEILIKIGLEHELTKFPSQLSGGQQQRVSIARAIVKNPNILFCDEPTGALDEETSKEVLSILEMLNKEYNTTVVVITHNTGIQAMSDKVVKMNSGKVVEVIKNKTKISAKEIVWA